MRKFLSKEKPKQAAFKENAPYFSEAARAEGIYKDHSYSFCLPRDYARDNLFSEIQKSIISYFKQYGIRWHDGKDGNPSNHLCDSQVCCANFLFPFADKPRPLAALLRSVYPSINKMLPIENGLYVAFEWIGKENYLKENKSRNKKRTRGANFTSADAMVMFERNDGRKQIVLIEWKYTEAYYRSFLKFSKSGTDRTAIYKPLYHADSSILDKELLPSFDALFYEPFYQFMRQQYLANEMEKENELGADFVSLLHIAPTHNTDFRRITSPDLQSIGETAIDVWSKIVKKPGKFISVSTEQLYGTFDTSQYPELKDWYKYITNRYAWITE
ncbi:hypothetical protein H8E88_22035 [candidate division KSB1 bacterium]|nr:hypothetical protein [candidate division KSB1 bacterium]